MRQRATQPPAQGREAVYAAAPSTVDPQPSAVDHLPSTVDRWEDTHKRVTFYCPAELLAAVEAEMKRSGRSKTQVIADALAAHLGRQE